MIQLSNDLDAPSPGVRRTIERLLEREIAETKMRIEELKAEHEISFPMRKHIQLLKELEIALAFVQQDDDDSDEVA